jgi:DNA-binding PadR family transcriptional regulator
MSALTPDETILGMLLFRPQHGYELLDAFQDPARLGNIWDMSTSQLYAVLKRLDRQGWIVGRQVESDNAPPRTEYSITDVGEAHLRAWLSAPNPFSSVRRVRVEFLSRLYIAQLLGWPTQPLITDQRQACQTERERVISRQVSAGAGVGYWASELQVAQLDAILQWIDRYESVLYPVMT